MALDTGARDQLFAAAPAPVIAIERAGRAPVAVPIWHEVEPDGSVWILMAADSLKSRLLREAGRCTIVADELEPRVRYAAAELEVVEERPGTAEDRERIARSHLPAEAVEGYLAFAASQVGDEVVFVLRPVGWLSADLG